MPAPALIAEHVTATTRAAIDAVANRFKSIEWNRAAISAAIKETLAEHSLKMPQLAIPMRVLLTGQTQTPAIDAVLEAFGRERVLARIGG